VPENHLVPPIGDSALALARVGLGPGEEAALADPESDSLLYVAAGAGTFAIGGRSFELGEGAAGLVLAGEEATLSGGEGGLVLVHATAGAAADRHAPLGPRETIVSSGGADTGRATGARSFRLLFGPHNGSTLATLFVGFVPPGKAPWHYHLYDEIVWLPTGPGRLHKGDAVTELGPGSAFRLRPREVHMVENTSPDRELAVVGVFTPAGSPSAAYLMPDVAAEYRFAG
jgi:quercetin dioxygenase-like cupin family protein